MAASQPEGNGVKWWRSRYVQHLEAENAELRETVKRMLNPQWRYLLYGEQVSDAHNTPPTGDPVGTEQPKDRVKLPGRQSWSDIAAKATHMFSPEGMLEQKQKQHEQHLHSVRERIG